MCCRVRLLLWVWPRSATTVRRCGYACDPGAGAVVKLPSSLITSFGSPHLHGSYMLQPDTCSTCTPAVTPWRLGGYTHYSSSTAAPCSGCPLQQTL